MLYNFSGVRISVNELTIGNFENKETFMNWGISLYVSAYSGQGQLAFYPGQATPLYLGNSPNFSDVVTIDTTSNDVPDNIYGQNAIKYRNVEGDEIEISVYGNNLITSIGQIFQDILSTCFFYNRTKRIFYFEQPDYTSCPPIPTGEVNLANVNIPSYGLYCTELIDNNDSYTLKDVYIAPNDYIHLYSYWDLVNYTASKPVYVLSRSSADLENIKNDMWNSWIAAGGSDPESKFVNFKYLGVKRFGVKLGNIENISKEYIKKSQPYEPGGESSQSGGGGSFGKNPNGTPEQSDNVTDSIPVGSDEPDIGSGNLFSLYPLTVTEFNQLGKLYWEGWSDILSFITTDPINLIVSLRAYPFDLRQFAGYQTIKQPMFFGRYKIPLLEYDALNSTTDYFFDWGDIKINEYWGNFLDYSPYTKIELYLSWGVGTVPLDANEVNNKILKIRTNIDIKTGNFVHVVYADGAILGTYNGVVGSSIPVTGTDISSKIPALVATAVTGLELFSGFNIPGNENIGPALKELPEPKALSIPNYDEPAINIMPNIAQASGFSGYKPFLNPVHLNQMATVGAMWAMGSVKVPRSGSFNQGASSLSPSQPFIIITRPQQDVPENYGHHFGYPCNINAKIGELRGYTEIASVHLNNISCLEAERDELLNILMGGVIL